jgi:uncharacterized membrane protein
VARIDPRIPLLIGAAGGMRTFVPPAVLALDGRISGRARPVVLTVAAGELVADQFPAIPSRLEARGLTGRLVSSALAGRALTGDAGAAPLAAGAAFASAQVCARARAALSARAGHPHLWALAEDLLALGVGALAVRRAWR